MAQRLGTSIARATGKSMLGVSRFAFRTTGNLAEGLFRWCTTDNLGVGRSLSNMPRMGFLDSLGYIAWTLVYGIVGALVAGLTAFVLIAYGIPLVFDFLFFM
jgi:hypothetical protein